MNIVWQEFLKIVHEEAGSRVVETWFKAVNLARWDAEKKIAYLEAPNDFVEEWLKNHYLSLMQHHLGRLFNEKLLSIVFIKNNMLTSTLIADQKTAPVYQPAQSLVTTKASNRTRIPINSMYQFETFIVGPSNTLAFSAAHAVAEKPGKLYNPLFIYGGSGLGKTHLLHAIGNHIQKHNKKINILYQSAERFLQEFINAIRFDKTYQFESKYKDLDLLLVDDIQFISHKEQTQEAFFHIFNALHQTHKQVVFTSDSLPRDIAGLAERMKSRLEGGLVADIHMPQLETKIAILKQKAEHNNEHLPDETAHYIASHSFSNIRELEGALIRISAMASLLQQPITQELAQKVLSKRTEEPKNIDMQKIVHHVSRHFNYSIGDIRSIKRNKDLALARHIAMYLMKKLTSHSLKEIGTFLSRKDHSTVIHAYEKIESHKESDNNFSKTLERIEQEITT